MKILKRSGLLVVILIVLLGFQNCSQFKATPLSEALLQDSTEIPLQPLITVPPLNVEIVTTNAVPNQSCQSVDVNGMGRPTLSLQSPVAYQVFQRGPANQNHTGPIFFTGSVDSIYGVTCIEIRMQSRLSGQSSPWIRITPNAIAANGAFNIPVSASPDSFVITVRGINNGYRGPEYTISNVGVGEVFAVAGQSNSSFAGDTPLMTTTNGMVSFFDGTNWIKCSDSALEPSSQASLSNMGRIDPYGPVGNLGVPGQGRQGGSVWCPFGDALYAKWGVPIAIAPLVIGGTNIFKWLPQADADAQDLPPYVSYASSVEHLNQVLSLLPAGDPNRTGNSLNYAAAQIAGAYGYYNFDVDQTHNPYMEAPPAGGPWVIENDQAGICKYVMETGGLKYNSCMRKGFAFARLVARLKYFAARGGLRAVLWHQGESDSTYQNSLLSASMDPDYYSKALARIISLSRIQRGIKNVPWLVSHVGVTLSALSTSAPAGQALPAFSQGIFAPHTTPTRLDVQILHQQQDKVINNQTGTTPFVYMGVDSDQIIGQMPSGQEIYRSVISFPHFNQNELQKLGLLWRDAVSNAFPSP